MGTYSDIRYQRYQTELDIGTSDIGLKRAESDIISDIGRNFYPISDIRHPKIHKSAQWLRKQVSWVGILLMWWIFFGYRISEWTQMAISEPFRYRNDSFQSDIFSSDIGTTDVDVGCRISPKLRSMSMPTYAHWKSTSFLRDTDTNFFVLFVNKRPHLRTL